MNQPSLNTHNVIVDFGKYEGEPYTRIPVSYLRWMVNACHRKSALAQAELDRRGITVKDRDIEISGHAIDRASLSCRKIWHEDRGDQEGLHAWLLRICDEALDMMRPDDQGRIHYKGMRLVFERGELYQTLKTVMRKKS